MALPRRDWGRVYRRQPGAARGSEELRQTLDPGRSTRSCKRPPATDRPAASAPLPPWRLPERLRILPQQLRAGRAERPAFLVAARRLMLANRLPVGYAACHVTPGPDPVDTVTAGSGHGP